MPNVPLDALPSKSITKYRTTLAQRPTVVKYYEQSTLLPVDKSFTVARGAMVIGRNLVHLLCDYEQHIGYDKSREDAVPIRSRPE